jgi:hypothetical protein
MSVPVPSPSKEALERLLARFDDIPDEEVPPELIPKLEEIRKELRLATVCYLVFVAQAVDDLTFSLSVYAVLDG